MPLGLDPRVWGQYSWETSFSKLLQLVLVPLQAADVGGIVDQGEEDGFGGFGW